jgi:hypothetical protein
MKAAGGRAINTALNPSGPYGPPPHKDQGEYVEMFLVVLMAASALLAFSLLLPDSLALTVQKVVGWGLVVGLSALGFLVARQAFKVLQAVDRMLDE